MACDCDELNNRLRRLNDDFNRLRRQIDRGSSSGGGGGGSLNQMDEERIIKKAVERTYNDKRFKAVERILTIIRMGNA